METRFRVLVCGNDDVRIQLATMLSPHATVVEVSTGDEALRVACSHAFHAVFIDTDRTDENGLEIAARMRRLISRRVRLIAVTESNRTSDLAASRNVGFDLKVERPIKVEQVLAALHTIRSPLP
jgi:CheY-like chemotaxis protein